MMNFLRVTNTKQRSARGTATPTFSLKLPDEMIKEKTEEEKSIKKYSVIKVFKKKSEKSSRSSSSIPASQVRHVSEAQSQSQTQSRTKEQSQSQSQSQSQTRPSKRNTEPLISPPVKNQKWIFQI